MRKFKIVRRFFWHLGKWWVAFDWFIFAPYYERLLIQAQFLYRQSDLYRFRWQELGIDLAERLFSEDAAYFFHKAKKEPFRIRWRLFCDAILKRKMIAYYF